MRLVVVGGSDAGISAALRAKECEPATSVTLLLADRYPNYSICGLPFYLSGEVGGAQSLAHRSEEAIRSSGIDILMDHVVERIDPRAKTVTARACADLRTLSYDRLVIATGAAPLQPPLPGVNGNNVFRLHTMSDAFRLHERLRTASSAAIIGGGYIGVEMADALRHRGLHVTLIERLPSLLTTVDPEIGAAVAELLGANGVRVLTNAAVESIESDGARGRVVTAGSAVISDVVLLAVGVKPNAELAANAGAVLGERGAIRVDRQMRTSLPDVWAAGDCVETWHRLLGRNSYLPLGTTSHKQGRIAGENAVGGAATFAGVVGSQAVKIFDRVVAGTGLTSLRATEAGIEVHVADTLFDDHKAYYAGASPLRIRILGNRRNGRLVGAQLMGRWGAEVAKRADVFAAALHHETRVDELNELDLTYTPPISSPWDPIQMAAQSWAASLAGA